MDRLKTILVPVDFSDRSVAAAEHAVVLAKKFDSNLIFLHTVPRTAYEYTGFEGGAYVANLPTKVELATNAEQRLATLIEKVSPDRPVAKLVLFGYPADEIIRQTHETEIDLIVMPTHGYGVFRRFLLGSVAAKVLHDVTCPVLTGAHVPEIPPTAANPYQRIVCAVDLTEHSEVVLRWAHEFAQAYGAKLDLIHVVPEITHGTPYGEWYPTNLGDILVKTGREKADDVLKKAGCEAEVHITSGAVSREVKNFAEQSGADLVIVGRSSGEASLGRLKANAYGIVRESPCPVISV